MTGAPNNLGLDPFPDPVGHFGAHWQAVRRCRRCGVAGGVALQAVRRCRRWASAPCAARLVFHYFVLHDSLFNPSVFWRFFFYANLAPKCNQQISRNKGLHYSPLYDARLCRNTLLLTRKLVRILDRMGEGDNQLYWLYFSTRIGIALAIGCVDHVYDFWIQKSHHFYNIWIQKFVGAFSWFLDPEITAFLKFLDPETAPFLQFQNCHSITSFVMAGSKIENLQLAGYLTWYVKKWIPES